VGTRQVCDGLRNDFAANATEGRSVEATCTAAGTTCSCNVRLEVTRANTTIPITIEGDTLVYPDGTRQDFCVKGAQLDLGPAQGAGIDNSYSIHVRADP